MRQLLLQQKLHTGFTAIGMKLYQDIVGGHGDLTIRDTFVEKMGYNWIHLFKKNLPHQRLMWEHSLPPPGE